MDAQSVRNKELAQIRAAAQLFYVLTQKNMSGNTFPPPWKLEYHRLREWHSRRHVSKIIAANGKEPLILETHTGDGDDFRLSSEGAEALVAFVNDLCAAGL
jgi:hypothetical protein